MVCPSGLLAAVENPICKCHWQFLGIEQFFLLVISPVKRESQLISDATSWRGAGFEMTGGVTAWLWLLYSGPKYKDVFIWVDSDGDRSGESRKGASNWRHLGGKVNQNCVLDIWTGSVRLLFGAMEITFDKIIILKIFHAEDHINI